MFILAPSLSAFFVEYSLTGGLITLVVSMAPTLGQTLFTFVLQVSGTGLGSLYGMTILYIFRYAGGYFYNPYGISCLVALFAVPLCWIIYSYPIYFAFALLALNGAGTIIVTEYVYGDVPGQIRPAFDSPALRCGKALVSMSIALVIAGLYVPLLVWTSADLPQLPSLHPPHAVSPHSPPQAERDHLCSGLLQHPVPSPDRRRRSPRRGQVPQDAAAAFCRPARVQRPRSSGGADPARYSLALPSHEVRPPLPRS